MLIIDILAFLLVGIIAYRMGYHHGREKHKKYTVESHINTTLEVVGFMDKDANRCELVVVDRVNDCNDILIDKSKPPKEDKP